MELLTVVGWSVFIYWIYWLVSSLIDRWLGTSRKEQVSLLEEKIKITNELLVLAQKRAARYEKAYAELAATVLGADAGQEGQS